MVNMRTESKPIAGAIAGLMTGLVFGVLGVTYFEIAGALDRLCLTASSMLVFQLLGATIAAALGKPHDSS
jgi:hypothetical protein